MQFNDMSEKKNKLIEIFLKEIENKKIAIYGSGYVGLLFYKAILRRKINSKIACFLQSKVDKENEINGITIKSISDLSTSEDIVICVAVHEAIRDEVIDNIKRNGFLNYYYVYPLIYDLLLGAPKDDNCLMPLMRIWNSSKNNYALAVRYLVLEQYYGLRDDGYTIYKELFTKFSDVETAKKRLDKFIDLIKKFEENGYDFSKKIIVLDDGSLVDGYHRASLAIFNEMNEISCTIYSKSMRVEEIHSPQALLSKKCCLDLGIDNRIIQILEETNNRIDNKWLLNG